MRKNTFSRLFIQATAHNNHIVFIFCVLVTSLAWSLFLTSACVFIILGLAVLNFFNNSTVFKKKSLPIILPYASVSVLLLLTLLSFLWSENVKDWWLQVRLKSPLFVLPLSFYFLPTLSKKQFYLIFWVLIIFLGCYALFLITDYALHTKTYTQLLYFGQPVPHIRDHVRFSILAAFTLISGLLILEQYWISQKIKIVLICSCGLIFIMLHVISARSGVLITYVSLIVYFFRLAWMQKKIVVLMMGIIFLGAMPFIAFNTIASFRQKIEYVLWDRKMQLSGDAKTYSDGERWIANDIGLKIFQENKFFGTGAGDLWQTIQAKYAIDKPNFEPKMPHNQFIAIAASLGAIGVLIFIVSFFYLGFINLEELNNIKYFFILNMLLAFFFDIPLEAEFGIVFYAFFASFLIHHRQHG